MRTELPGPCSSSDSTPEPSLDSRPPSSPQSCSSSGGSLSLSSDASSALAEVSAGRWDARLAGVSAAGSHRGWWWLSPPSPTISAPTEAPAGLAAEPSHPASILKFSPRPSAPPGAFVLGDRREARLCSLRGAEESHLATAEVGLWGARS